jgi:hypothetical protein
MAQVAPTRSSWPPSAILLLLAGITLIGTGLYFLLLRPPLLPEDVRYMGLNEAQLVAVRPRLEMWLTHVFRVMGGYILANGVLAATLAATSFRTYRWAAWLGALIGGTFSIGWMAIVNWIIDSDFKLVLSGMAAVWAASLMLFCLEEIRRLALNRDQGIAREGER